MIDRFYRGIYRIGDGDVDREIESLLFERDGACIGPATRLFYALKPLVPRRLQLALRRQRARKARSSEYRSAESICFAQMEKKLAGTRGGFCWIWFWPRDFKMASILTHDVETADGYRLVLKLAAVDEKHGFRSCFNFVPERYNMDAGVFGELRDRGFEIGVHGLRHDGRMFNSHEIFTKRLSRIEGYAESWRAVGFRSPALLRHAGWMQAFRFEWDSSFPDYDLFGPQAGGCRTVFPFFLSPLTVELPVTLMQDHTLFEILCRRDIEPWQEKVDHILKNNGLANIIVHPDYIFDHDRLKYYEQYLEYLRTKEGVWAALPREVSRWWRARDASSITDGGDGRFAIDGPAAGDGMIVHYAVNEE